MKKMRKFTALVAVAAMVMAMFGCGEKAADEFVVGFDAEFPPYGYMDEAGEYVGFDLELAEEVCNRLGMTLVKKPIDWDTKDALIDSGEIDCIWNGFTINGREDAYTWTKAYVNNSQVYVVAANAGIKSQADLGGKIIGVQKASAALDAINADDYADIKNGFDSIKEYDSYVIAFEDLAAGGIDALAIDIGVAQAQMAKREAGTYVILDDYLSAEKYGVGFKLGNTALRDKVEATLMDLYKEGYVTKVAEKYGIDPDAICLGE